MQTREGIPGTADGYLIILLHSSPGLQFLFNLVFSSETKWHQNGCCSVLVLGLKFYKTNHDDRIYLPRAENSQRIILHPIKMSSFHGLYLQLINILRQLQTEIITETRQFNASSGSRVRVHEFSEFYREFEFHEYSASSSISRVRVRVSRDFEFSSSSSRVPYSTTQRIGRRRKEMRTFQIARSLIESLPRYGRTEAPRKGEQLKN